MPTKQGTVVPGWGQQNGEERRKTRIEYNKNTNISNFHKKHTKEKESSPPSPTTRKGRPNPWQHR